jgi:hypothetical protein
MREGFASATVQAKIQPVKQKRAVNGHTVAKTNGHATKHTGHHSKFDSEILLHAATRTVIQQRDVKVSGRRVRITTFALV